MNLLFRCLFAGGIAVGVAGCVDTGPTPTQALSSPSASGGQDSLRLVENLPPPTDSGGGTEQPLSPNDVLQVEVFQAETLNRTVQIDSTGRISLPLIGTVTAAGKTVRRLEQEIAAAYGRSYLQNPVVTIFLKDSAGQRVTVDGEVIRAGIYPITANTTLLEVIALAGGFRNIADPEKVYVFRDIGGQKLVANYSVADIRSGRRTNPRIYGRDVVIVFTSDARVAFNNLKDALQIAVSAARLATPY